MSDLPELRIGLWQAPGTQGDVAANLAEVSRVARNGAGSLDLLVFPECFLTGYYTPDPVRGIARDVTPARLEALSDLAAETGTALVVGSYEPDRDKVCNSAFVFTPTAGHVGTYRKQMLFGDWEKQVFCAGKASFDFDLKGFKVGLLICYDIEFPERARELALQGADLIAVPTALMAPFDTVPTITVPARAIENQCFIAYANRVGQDAVHRYLGSSCIVDPLGRHLASAKDREGLASATLRLAARTEARREFDYLTDLSQHG